MNPIDSDNPDLFQFSEEAFEYLRQVGTMADADIDLAETSLALGLIFLPKVHVDRYRQHLRKLGEQVNAEFQARLRRHETDSVAMRAEVLRKILHEAHDYQGDIETYDHIDNANLIRVIERRKGLPVALGILYIILARGMGWDCEGLNFPGHFVLRLEMDSTRIILDPFRKGREMNAAELRQLLKSVAGKKAELSHHFYEPVANRDILVRLENNLKKRLIDGEDYAQAILVLDAIAMIAPDEYRVLLDKGVLLIKLKRFPEARQALELYRLKTPHPQEKELADKILVEMAQEE
jgi:regulator of sirC expression with transglutaminase-like and TPR domain